MNADDILEELKSWPVEEVKHLADAIANLDLELSKRDRYESKHERLLLANADYEARSTETYKPSLRATERWYGLKAGSLVNFRANRTRRKLGLVGKVRKYDTQASSR